jgi:F0F1-type ATP synthase epsilon subunit
MVDDVLCDVTENSEGVELGADEFFRSVEAKEEEEEEEKEEEEEASKQQQQHSLARQGKRLQKTARNLRAK